MLNPDCDINTSRQEERGEKKRNGGRGEEDREQKQQQPQSFGSLSGNPNPRSTNHLIFPGSWQEKGGRGVLVLTSQRRVKG